MRTAITTIALAGLSTAVSAQTVGTVTVTSSASTVNVGDTFTIGVHLNDNISTISVWRFDLVINGVGAAFSTVPGSLTPHPSINTDPDYVDYFGFLGQLNPDGAQGYATAPDALGPTLDIGFDDLTVFTFQVTAQQAGSITFSPNAPSGYAFDAVFTTVSSGVGVFIPWLYDEIIFNNATVNVIPAPPAIGALGILSMITTRRRR